MGWVQTGVRLPHILPVLPSVCLLYTSRGDVAQDGGEGAAEPVLVRVHSHCLAGDAFGTTLCDCQRTMRQSLKMIAEAGRGALIYLHNASRGFEVDRSVEPHRIVFHREARARERHEDRHQRILREVGLGGQILADLGIHRIRLLSNTPTHVPALEGFSVQIVEQVKIPMGCLLYTSRCV